MGIDPKQNDHGSQNDGILAELNDHPFRVHRPREQAVAFAFASPHSGRSYPESFVARSRLSFEALRRSEDAFVEELFLFVADLGAPLIAAAFPRAYVDLNRAPAELDAAMFDGPLPVPADPTSPRVQAGLGVIPRIVREGAEIYRGKLSADEARLRLGAFYRPYHAELARLANDTEARFGLAVMIDCHSMPSAPQAPDIVLGDRYGVAASPLVTRSAEEAFLAQGFSVVRNIPYAGGYSTQIHGRPALRRHALQIEINRALYLDEDRMQPSSQFAAFHARLMAGIRTLLACDTASLRRQPRYAAE
jgi:N-formylglutamate deformylase